MVAAAKIAILDGVANMVAGSVEELSDIIGRYVRDGGGSPQSSVVGWGYQTNPPSAAFANGVFGHCLDYEIQGFPAHSRHLFLPAGGPGLGANSITPPASASSPPIPSAGKSRDGCAPPRPRPPRPATIRPAWSGPWEERPPRPKSWAWKQTKP